MKYNTFKQQLKLKDTVLDRRRKLTLEDVDKMKLLYESGEVTQAELADIFNVSSSAVYYHLGGETVKTKNRMNRVACYYKKSMDERQADSKKWKQSSENYKQKLFNALSDASSK